MAYLKTLFRGNIFGGDHSQSGYSQPRADINDPSALKDIETQSASVNLEDIIDEYDESSQRSRTTASPSRRPADEQQPNSHSFFSFTGTRDDETTSFYSALHDGFSLDEFDSVTRNGNNNESGREFLWQKSGHNHNNSDELDVMMPRPDFQVTWTDLTYRIKSSATYTDVWGDFKDKLATSFSSALALINYFRSSQYDVTGMNDTLTRDTVTILQGVTGSFRSGEMTAIMGPSGAGKTSLLNILARRHETGFTGRLSVSHNDHKIKINSIPQDDHLLETLTARENLLYASKLKNPFSSQDHEKCVNSVSVLLGLNDCLDTKTKSLSGGQQKRLAIAQELLSRPDILILDEPTSGLDSLTCLKTLSVLKDLVKPARRDMIDPIAIILTIHQPQQEAFKMFDKVYVMATGGITIYDGPPDQCVSYIEKYSGLKMPSDDYNPATFLIEIASGEYGQEPVDALARQVRLDAFRSNAKSMFGAAIKSSAITLSMDPKKLEAGAKKSLKDLEEMTGSFSSVQTVGDSKGKAELFLDPRLVKRSPTSSSNFLYKTMILAKRCFKTSMRDPLQMIGRILFHLLLPFGLVFLLGSEPGTANACPSYQSEYSIKTLMKSDEYLDPERQEQFFLALENIGILFCSMYACVSASIASNTLIFALDLRTCLKEYHNGWYPMNSYVFGRIIANLPLDLMLPLIQMAMTFAVTGQNTGADDQYYMRRIIISGSAIVLASLVGEIMGMVIGIIYLGHITTALFASQAITLPFVMLSGFVARTKNMSKLVQLMSYTSLYKHCLEAVFIARYGWNVCGCKTGGDFKQVTLTGVSDDLRRFVKNFMTTANEDSDETTTTKTISSPISIALNSTDISTPELEDKEDDDVFQMVAKQLSLFNTYGVEVRSCDQVLPYEMHDFGLHESQLTTTFSALIGLLLAMLIVLLFVVKFVLATRTAM